MLLTTTTLILFLVISLASIGIGIFAKRQELYILGIVIMLFMGLMTFQFGIAEATGEVRNETIGLNATSTVVTTTYDMASPVWTNSISLLFIVIAAGLGLYFYNAGKEEEQKKRDSIEIED